MIHLWWPTYHNFHYKFFSSLSISHLISIWPQKNHFFTWVWILLIFWLRHLSKLTVIIVFKKPINLQVLFHSTYFEGTESYKFFTLSDFCSLHLIFCGVCRAPTDWITKDHTWIFLLSPLLLVVFKWIQHVFFSSALGSIIPVRINVLLLSFMFLLYPLYHIHWNL